MPLKEKNHKRKTIIKKIALYPVIGIATILILFYAVLLVFYPPAYVYRYSFWQRPDISDFRKFPTKEIHNSGTVFHFDKKLDPETVEFWFLDEQLRYGAKNFKEYADLVGTTALIVIKNDTIIYEDYFNGFKRDDYFLAMSMTKVLVNMLVGIASDEGYIKSIEDPITDYLPELLERDLRFEQIKIKHLQHMCSGIEQRKASFFDTGIPLPWDGRPLDYYYPNIRKYILENLRIISEPGKYYYYNDFNAELLGLILERSIESSVSEYLEEKIWGPLEMEYPALWCLDSEKNKFERKSAGLFARAIDYAKIGRLVLHRGKWNGKQIIPAAWANEMISDEKPIKLEPYYPGWWYEDVRFRRFYKCHLCGHVNADSSCSLCVVGDLGQIIYISPHKNLIIIHCGKSNEFYNEKLWYVERSIDNQFYRLVHTKGVSEAIDYYHSARRQNSNEVSISEGYLDTMGAYFLLRNSVQDAIALFNLNVEVHPLSSRAYLKLGTAFMKQGNKELALKNLRISLKLNPNNENAKKALARINEAKDEN